MPFYVVTQPQLDPERVRQGARVLIAFQGTAFDTHAEVESFLQWMRVPTRERDGSLSYRDTSTWQVVEARSKEAAADIVLRAAYAAAGLPPPPPYPRHRHVQLGGVVQEVDRDTGAVTLSEPERRTSLNPFIDSFLLREQTRLRRAGGDAATTDAIVPGVVVLGHGERQDNDIVTALELEIHVLPTTP